MPFVTGNRELPTDSAERRWFTALFKEMCAKVRTIQRADGAWSASVDLGRDGVYGALMFHVVQDRGPREGYPECPLTGGSLWQHTSQYRGTLRG